MSEQVMTLEQVVVEADSGVRYTIGHDAPIWAEAALADALRAFLACDQHVAMGERN